MERGEHITLLQLILYAMYMHVCTQVSTSYHDQKDNLSPVLLVSPRHTITQLGVDYVLRICILYKGVLMVGFHCICIQV